MDREERIEQEVQKTLGQLGRGERVTPRPFFYARVKDRLKEQDTAKGRGLIPAVLRPALLMLLIACNIATMAFLLKEGVVQDIDRSDVVSAIGDELGLESHDIDLFLTE